MKKNPSTIWETELNDEESPKARRQSKFLTDNQTGFNFSLEPKQMKSEEQFDMKWGHSTKVNRSPGQRLRDRELNRSNISESSVQNEDTGQGWFKLSLSGFFKK